MFTMTYQYFKTSFILSCCMLATSQVLAFQPTKTTTFHNNASLHSSRSSRQEEFKNSNVLMSSPFLIDSSKTTLYYKNLDDHEEQQYTTSEGSGTTSASAPITANTNIQNTMNSNSVALPRTIDLPKASFARIDNAKNEKVQEIMLTSEMLIGRIAMMMAAYLLAEEVFTGSSLLDQLQNVTI